LVIWACTIQLFQAIACTKKYQNPSHNQAMTTWQDELQLEFEHAEQARTKGNEGQARVCARRAAGMAIREYFIRRGTHPPNLSMFDLLNLIKEDSRLFPDLKLIADHLTVRVTDGFILPVDADLVAEARQLCNELLKQMDFNGNHMGSDY
jgi:hypothetical protein